MVGALIMKQNEVSLKAFRRVTICCLFVSWTGPAKPLGGTHSLILGKGTEGRWYWSLSSWLPIVIHLSMGCGILLAVVA